MDDSRASTENLLGASGTTLSDIYDPEQGVGPAFDDTKSMYDSENLAFAEWWNGYSVMMRMHAMAESAFATINDYFPYARCGNYRAFVADNPAFKISLNQTVSFNTPLGVAFPGGYSSPILYSPAPRLNNVRGKFGFGYTLSEVVRDFKRAGIDACASAFDAKPLAPWFDNIGRYMIKQVDPPTGAIVYEYTHTREDIWDGIVHAWKRGCDEFLIFFFGADEFPLEKFPDTLDTCARLRDWIHMLPIASFDRSARGRRVARR
ncbi:MAG: hypothetical protein ACF8R7_03065 [Phycisphaerales bacterium JB039]